MQNKNKIKVFLKKYEQKIVFIIAIVCISLISFNLGKLNSSREDLKIVDQRERLNLKFIGREGERLVFQASPQATIKLGEDEILKTDQAGNFSLDQNAAKELALRVYNDQEFLEIDLNQLLNVSPAVAGSVTEHKINPESQIEAVDKNIAKEGSEEEKVFVASKNSNIFHTLDCQYVQRIKEENKVWFSSKSEAEQAGFVPDQCVK